MKSEDSTLTKQPVSHLVDFGSGLSYLSRILVSPPYNLDLVVLGSKRSNIEAGKLLDIRAKLASRPLPPGAPLRSTEDDTKSLGIKKGSIQYVEKMIKDGDMTSVLQASDEK